MTTATELTTAEARQLTDRIKVAVEGTWLLIQEAYTSRAWAALGYRTWDEYCNAEFGTARLRLPREERQEVVASLREIGMSYPAIAAATGASVGTVYNAAQSFKTESHPDRTTGTDGKSYAATHSAPASSPFDGSDWVEPVETDEAPALLGESGRSPLSVATSASSVEPTKPKRRPLPEAFADAGRDLTKAAEKLTRLTEDDRFTRNRDATHHQVPELLQALEHTTRLIAAMNLPAAEASEEARRWWATSLHKISDTLTGVANTLEMEQ